MPVSYEDLKNSNPYRNQSYKESGWQRFLSSLGFRTQADAWKENMSVQAAEYDAAIAQKQFDTEYDSPSAQAARMRAAGLNPDLDPSSISPGSPGSMGEDPSTPMQSSGDEETLGNIANGVMSAFTSALGIVTTFQGIHRNHLENMLLGFNSSKAISDFAKDNWQSMLPDSAESEILDDGSEVSWQGKAYERAKMFSKHLPKRYRQQFIDNVSSYWSSAPASAEEFETWRKGIAGKKGYEVDKRTNFSFIDSDLAIIADELAGLHSKLEKQSLKTDIAKSESEESAAHFEGDVSDRLDPSAAAAAKNAQAGATTEQAQFQKEIHRSINNIIGKLNQNDDPFSKLLLIFISSMQMNLIPKF